MSAETLNFYQEPGSENRRVRHDSGHKPTFNFEEEGDYGIHTSINKTYDPGKKTWHVERFDKSESGDKSRLIVQDFTQVFPKSSEDVIFKSATDRQYHISFRNSNFYQKLESTEDSNDLLLSIHPRYGPIETVTTQYAQDHPHQNHAQIAFQDGRYVLDLTIKPHQRIPSAHFQIRETTEFLDDKEAREELLTPSIDIKLGERSIWLPDGTQGMVDYKDGYITTAFWSFRDPERKWASVTYPMQVPLRLYHQAATAQESADWLKASEIVPVHSEIPSLEQFSF